MADIFSEFNADEITNLPPEYGFVSIGVPGAVATVQLTNNGRISFHGVVDVDEQKPQGKNLGRPKHKGARLLEMSIAYVVYADDENHFWTKVYPFLRAKGDKTNGSPIEVYNSQVLYSGVTTYIVVDYQIGEPSNRDGREITLRLKQWVPQPVKPKVNTAAKKSNGRPKRDTDNAQVNVFDE